MSCLVHKLVLVFSTWQMLCCVVVRCVQVIVWLYLESVLSDRLLAFCHDKVDKHESFLKPSSVEGDLNVSCIV